MGVFLGKTIKGLLRLSLFVLLGAFFFGLIKFKGNFMEYVQYLNSISIQEIFSSQSTTGTGETQEIDQEALDEVLLEQEVSNILDDDGYFLPETVSGEVPDSTSFGFSGSLDEQQSLTGKQDSSPSVSKEDLVNLIKSHEK